MTLLEDARSTNSDSADAPSRQVALEIRRGRAKNRVRHVATPVFLIGRDADCDLVLGDPQFPETHSYLFVTPEGVAVRRLGDGPVLTVDGEEVAAAWLCDGARLRTGSYEFVVRIQHGGNSGRPRSAKSESSPSAAMPAGDGELSGEEVVAQLICDVRRVVLGVDSPRQIAVRRARSAMRRSA